MTDPEQTTAVLDVGARRSTLGLFRAGFPLVVRRLESVPLPAEAPGCRTCNTAGRWSSPRRKQLEPVYRLVTLTNPWSLVYPQCKELLPDGVAWCCSPC